MIYSNYTGCMVIIYNENGDELAQTQVMHHNTDASIIEISGPVEQEMPGPLELLILTSPAPCSYWGNVQRSGLTSTIALFKGREKEDRKSARHKLEASAIVENYIYGERIITSLPQEVKMLNISQSGARFLAKRDILGNGDKFQMRMKNNALGHTLVTEVVNNRDISDKLAEYGCRFLKVNR